ncbi:Protein SYG1 -like protein [Escovopsis weberi]|uniref:Protein SYG1-like protein n=1 Tax=Escovopsis weberi TaxID=150374 RepID=A0A0M8MT49_ESCWE|nr:Protein SYG1 -like protein [Escovopsis weberi]
MKFAKELEREAVPEWRIKYLNYKAGKKHVKAVARAINRATISSKIHHRRSSTCPVVPQQRLRPSSGDLDRNHDDDADRNLDFREEDEEADQWPPRSDPIDIAAKTESEGLTSNSEGLQYGSFVPTPPASSWPAKHFESSPDDLDLPSAAMDSREPDEQAAAAGTKSDEPSRKSMSARFASKRSLSSADVPRPSRSLSKAPSRDSISAAGENGPSQLRRIISHSREMSTSFSRAAFGRQSLDLVRKHEQDFFAFMDSELNKVETFYKQKEEQAGKRLEVLRVQLREMRSRRILEMAGDEQTEGATSPVEHNEDGSQDKLNGWVQPLKTKIFPLGPNSKAFKDMGSVLTPVSSTTTPTPALLSPNLASPGSLAPPLPSPSLSLDPRKTKDYVKRSARHQISYRTAKRKLKSAILEFYRSLELLKSYALLNRTAFRKLNKKFDKAVHTSPPLRFVNEKVNKSYFVNSLVLEEHIKTVEDLYSRYFERGNQKLAAGKLRRLTKKPKDESASAFKNGILLGTGLVFAVQGLVYGVRLLSDDDIRLRVHTNYLLQIYGGYFLMLYLFFLFCIDCYIWNRNKVNYPFIFEFDQRTQLDWRELSEFPSFCLLLLGLTMWANFSRYGNDSVFLYWPVLLITVTVFLILLPAPILAYRSRKWFAFSHGRLLCAGLFPVEFRDFFLGDMYCSLTYAMSNIELFFCLYARNWEHHTLCNSSHSRLLGFLTCLPPIWRFLQCIRRYRDTGNVFPHLVNCGKYSMSIIGSVCLSVYRIHRSDSNLALFITFNVINGIYCAIWDLFMDFSLLQPQSRYFYLRDITAFKRRWIYYTIMTVDPIFRFSWILYVIFTFNPRYATLVSFLVGLIEVTRRGIWALLRVENEHCSNVSHFKASRDVPLPYRIEPLLEQTISSDETIPFPALPALPEDHEAPTVRQSLSRESMARKSLPDHMRHAYTTSMAAPSAAVGAGEAPMPRPRHRTLTLHSRIGSRNFSQVLADAHKQDFERKRRPEEEVQDNVVPEEPSDDDDEDDEDEDLDANSFMDVMTPRRSLSRAESAA